MSLRLASARLVSSLGTTHLAAYKAHIRRSMSTSSTTEIFGRKIEKRTLCYVLTALGTVEGYFWYSTYYNSSATNTEQETISTESKPAHDK